MGRLKPRAYRDSQSPKVLVRSRPANRGVFYRFRLGFMAGLCGFAVLGALWFWLSGGPGKTATWFSRTALTASRKASFSLKDIIVEGRSHTGRDELLTALNIRQGDPIFVFDPEQALQNVKKMPWIEDAVIERRLPDTIIVRIKEREPLARWQINDKTVVIDRRGEELPQIATADFSSLFLVVGEDAPSHAASLLASIREFPDLAKITRAASRVGARRWNLHLKPDSQTEIVVRLPEKGWQREIANLDSFIREQKIPDRNIASIDMRVPGRIVLGKAVAPEDQTQEPLP